MSPSLASFNSTLLVNHSVVEPLEPLPSPSNDPPSEIVNEEEGASMSLARFVGEGPGELVDGSFSRASWEERCCREGERVESEVPISPFGFEKSKVFLFRCWSFEGGEREKEKGGGRLGS